MKEESIIAIALQGILLFLGIVNVYTRLREKQKENQTELAALKSENLELKKMVGGLKSEIAEVRERTSDKMEEMETKLEQKIAAETREIKKSINESHTALSKFLVEIQKDLQTAIEDGQERRSELSERIVRLEVAAKA